MAATNLVQVNPRPQAPQVTLPKKHRPGVRLFYVGSESNPAVRYAVQHIHKNRQDRWFCNCPQFIFRCLARKRWCKHIRLVATQGSRVNAA